MPKSPNYSKGIVYKLCCKDPNILECYVGSTLDFKNRKQKHKQCCCNENNPHHHYNVYQFIKSNGGWDNWDMIQLEQYEAKDKRDLEGRERFYIETLKSSLNKVIPTRTRKEFYNENKENILKQNKQYNEKNAEKISKQQKDYREKNAEKISKQEKEYYERNTEKISEQNKKKIQCECGSEIRQCALARHEKTKKHQTFLTTK